MKIVFCPYALALLLAIASSQASAADRLKEARGFLEEKRLHRGKVVPPENYDTLRKAIASTRDPETKFGPFVFALARKGAGQLSAEQSAEVEALITARRESEVNWHDVRNIVRMQATSALWAYAGERDAKKAAQRLSEWEAWTDLRLGFMFQEFVAQERFQRSNWVVYTPEQREKIRSGEWDELVKKNTGHGRLFSADKQVRKVLGTPDEKGTFDSAALEWRTKWGPPLKAYNAASLFQRQCEFAMDMTGEDFVVATWEEYAAAFRAFAVAEREAIRAVLQAGYESGPNLETKLREWQETMRRQTLEKYETQGAEFLRRLGLIDGNDRK